jgi:uncharacterized lipoprotein NlpE involved in copper resistance
VKRTTFGLIPFTLLLAVALAACGGEATPTTMPTVAAPTATPAPATEAATPTAEQTVAAGEAITATEAMTSAEEMTATEAMTSAEEMTATETVTATEEMTASEEITSGAEMSGTAEAAGSAFAGTYVASAPAASSPGRAISLTLSADGVVTMTTDYLNNEPPVIEEGVWAANDDGTATVTLTGQPDKPYDIPVVIVFALEGDTLTATEYDQSLYGSEGLTLEKES